MVHDKQSDARQQKTRMRLTDFESKGAGVVHVDVKKRMLPLSTSCVEHNTRHRRCIGSDTKNDEWKEG